MRGLLVERLRPFALVAFTASGALHLALLMPVIWLLRHFEHGPAAGNRRSFAIVSTVVVLLFAIVAYVADRLRGRALASTGRTFDRELIPAAIANSLEALRDVELLRSFLGSPGMLALFDLPWLPLYLLVIAWIHPLLGLAVLMGIALMILIVATAARVRTYERSDSLLPAARAANDQAEDLVRSAETIVAMGMSKTATIAWRERQSRFLSRRQQADRAAAHLGALGRAASLALQIGILVLGVWLVTRSRLSIAPMIAAGLLLNRTVQPLDQLIGNWSMMTAVHGAWRRLQKHATSIVVAGKTASAPPGSVQLDRACYAPSAGRPASIKNLTLALAPGESILIVGPSGSGKTTLARLLLGVLRPYSGTVRVGECVGYVSQEVQLFPGTIADNIARLGALDSTRVVQAARLAHAHEMIVRMPEGYHTEVCEAGSRLAPGQRRRIALARALYTNPRLLVLDEPSADLDAEGELALVKALAELKTRGTTVVIVGQRTNLVEHVDKLAILRDGTLQLFEPREPSAHSTATIIPLHRAAPQPL